MRKAAIPPSRGRSPHVLAAWSSMFGTSIEWFDFFLYGTAAALVFNKIFFPQLDPLTGTLAAFATYAVGFVGRPLGGLIFGHIGDRIGRKATLLLTLLLMGVPTVLIGLLPPYAVLGDWAAVLLVVLRLIQGIAVGGEWGGAVLMAVEHAPAGRRGFFGSLPQMGVGPGLILASAAMSLVSLLPEPQLLAWGWRIPFLASIVLLGVGWFIRRQVPESPEFLAAQEYGGERRVPAGVVLREHGRALLTIIGARVAENTWFYTVTTFALSYATGTLHLGQFAGAECGHRGSRRVGGGNAADGRAERPDRATQAVRDRHGDHVPVRLPVLRAAGDTQWPAGMAGDDTCDRRGVLGAVCAGIDAVRVAISGGNPL